MVRRVVVLAGFVLVACGDPDTPATDAGVETCPIPTGPTMHGGYLAADETWTAAGSPHLTTGDVFIQAGVTVTVEPCAVVQIKTGNFLTVDGRLLARGAAGRRITIKNAVEGERFASLRINATGQAELAFLDLSGGGAIPATNSGASVEVVGAGFPPTPSLLVNDVTVRDSAGLGILLRGWGAFDPASQGLVVSGAGAVAEQPGHPIRVSLNAVGSIPPGQYTGNRRDELQVVGESPHYQSEVDDRFFARGVPYYVGGNGAFGLIEVVHSTLTLDPGVTLRFETSSSNIGGMQIRALGALVAVGTESAPVVLAPPADQETPGAWEGLSFTEALGAGNRIEWMRIEYAGGHGGDSSFGCAPTTFPFATDAALKLFTEPSESFVHNTAIVNSSTHGIFEAWNGNFVDFLGSNSFENVAGCNLVSPKAADGSCPADPPCPK